MNSATIVAASLDSSQLEQSINALVSTVAKKTKEMADSFTGEVKRMEDAVKNLGNIKIDSGGAADSSISKQTKAQNNATQATDRRVQKEKELNMTLDQGGDILQKVARYASEVRLPDSAKSARESFQAFYKGFNEQARKLETLIKSWESLLQSRHTGNIEQVAQKIAQVKHQIAEVVKEQANLSKTKPQGYMEEIGKRNLQIKALRDQLVSLEAEHQKIKATDPFKGNPYLDELRAKHERVTNALRDEETTSKRLVQTTNELTDAQKKAIDASLQKSLAHTMKIPTNEIDLARAKLESLQSLLIQMGERGLLSNTQKFKINEEVQRLVNYIADADTKQQGLTSRARQYTDEVRKQAQAIREMKQWQEKGFVIIDGSNLSNQENVAKKKRVSLEEQILNLQQQGIYLSQDQTSKEWHLVDVSGRRIASIQQENENLAAQRERVAEIAKEVRSLFTEGSFSRVSFTPAPLSGVRFIYQENDERSKGLTIEQQIERILKEQSAEYERQASVKKASNNGSQRTLNDLQSQARAIEELLEKGKRVKALGGFEFIPADMSGQTVMQQIISYQEQRKAGLLAENQELNLQLELSNAIAQAQGRITQEQEKRKKYDKPTMTDDYQQILRNAVANKLGIDTSKVINADAQYDAIKRVGEALKQLQAAYIKMSNEERNSPIGKQMIRQMQELERQTQQLRAQMSRPISLKDALSGSEKTLDDIAYKMSRLSSYRMGLDVTDPKAMEEMGKVNTAINRLKKQYDDLMGKNQSMIASNNALGRSWNYMKNRLAFYFTVGASTQFVKNLIDIRGQYELLERSIGILIDSAQNGSRIFAELNSMAIKSPFTTMELGAAAKQLVAYDVAAKDVVDTTRRLADMAAAVGIPIERLTYALGQIKAYGYLNARDARMFANAGIPLVKELADRYTELEGRLVSTADVYDRIKKKAISYEDVMDTVNKMTDEGGKFFNFQEKAADTLKVRIANLTLAWNNMMNEMGKDNQGVLAGGLKMLKNVFEHWRDIYNLLLTIIVTLGILKTAQIIVLTTTAMRIKENIALWTALEFAMRKSLGAAIVNNLKAIGSLLLRFANPLFLTTAAITALGIAIGKVVFDYKDLIAANEAFNKSISDNAKENITSIEKFFEDYKKQFSNISGLNNADQEKLWERLQEEIEKTTKNAEEYVNILNDVERVSSRIRLGEDVLEQSKIMQRELQRLADSGTFNIGGGFADDSAAKDLQEYQKALNEIRQEYGSVNAAIEAHTMKSRKLMADYTTQRDEVRKELNDFVSKLDNAYMPDILGQSDDVRIQMANVRSFAESLRDAFIATEEGSKIGTDGIAILNSEIDKWVAKQGVANNLIVNANGDFDEQRAKIEENKTAWEEFFRYISNKDKEYLDAAIKTNDLGSDEVRKIWDKAAEEMSKRSTTSYNLIQDQIAQLRNTPDIVINVVYKEQNRESADKQINEYQEKYMTPSYVTFNEPSKYIEERKRLTEVYGRFIKKEGESNVEWEKRLGQEYQDNIKNIESLNNMLKSSSIMSETDREAKENERKALEDYNKTLLEVGKNEGFNYDQFKKGGKGNKGGSKKDPVLDALKQEINLVEKLQGDYDKLTKSGASQEDALSTIRSAYGNTIKNINSQLNKFGLPEVASTLITGKDPNKALEHFKSTLDNLVKKGMLSLERSKEVEAVIQKFTLSAQTYNLDKITKGLNNELDRLKDEYELAVSLDADPELGNAFAEMMGINMETLPRTVEEYASQYTKYLNKFLNEKNTGLELPHLNLTDDDLRSFKEMVEQQKLSEEAYNAIVAAVKDVSSKRNKEISDAIKGWDKLIEKYGEYEAKINAIRNDVTKERAGFVNKFGSEDQKSAAIRLSTLIQAEQDPNEKQKLIEQLKALVDEVAGNDATRLKIKTAIDTFGLREEARIKFEEFQKTPEWVTATGELSGMTNKAIGGLIKSLEKYKKSAKNLDPKQIKNINNALKNLYKEQRKGNPFGAIADMLDRAKERMVDVEPEMESIMKDILAIEDEIGDGEATEEQIKTIEDLKERWKSLSEVGKTSAQEWVASITSVYDAVKGAIQLFDDLAKAVGGKNASDVEKMFGILDKAVQGAQVGAAFGTYGAAIGAAVGGLAAGIKTYSDELSGNKAISDSIREQEQLVVRLTNQYKVLEDAIENSYAIERYGAQRAALANKELQLSAIKRQLALEESRKSKNKDEEKIESLRGQIIDLELEIKNGINEIANDMLGISSVGDAAENLVSSMIQAFRSGEDYMKSYSDAFSDMIDNMVTKSIVSEVIGKRIEEIFAQVKDISNTRADKTMFSAIDVTGGEMQRLAGSYERTFEDWAKTLESWIANPNISQEDKTQYERWLENLRNLYTQAITPTVDDVQGIREKRDEWQSEVKEIFDAYMDAFGITFGQDKEGTNLSALQAGIQGITEDTAGALEAYMNGVSQQVYLHSDLLTQIRDAIVGFNLDVQVATMSQILLQLQSSYTVQMSIQGILEGWSSPNGMAVRVEMQ